MKERQISKIVSVLRTLDLLAKLENVWKRFFFISFFPISFFITKRTKKEVDNILLHFMCLCASQVSCLLSPFAFVYFLSFYKLKSILYFFCGMNEK